jgi:hypothetical protein
VSCKEGEVEGIGPDWKRGEAVMIHNGTIEGELGGMGVVGNFTPHNLIRI